MSAKNRVLSGDYAGKQILGGGVSQAGISIGFVKQLYLNKTTVESYEVINNENQKSMASGVARGIVGGALLGGVGAIAGANKVCIDRLMGHKSKGTGERVYTHKNIEELRTNIELITN